MSFPTFLEFTPKTRVPRSFQFGLSLLNKKPSLLSILKEDYTDFKHDYGDSLFSNLRNRFVIAVIRDSYLTQKISAEKM